MFDHIEEMAVTVPFGEFMALQTVIMTETAHDEGFSGLDEWATACPERFEEVSRDLRRTYRVYNLK